MRSAATLLLLSAVASAQEVPLDVPISLLVADYAQNRVQLRLPDGTIARELRGVLGPSDVQALPGGGWLVVESARGRVAEFDADGNVSREIGRFASPRRARRLASGRTLVVDADGGQVVEIDGLGTVAWRYAAEGLVPYDAERLADGNTVIADAGSGRVFEVDAEGRTIWILPGLGEVRDVDVLPSGNLLVVETQLGRVRELTRGAREAQVIDGLDLPTDATRLPNGVTLVSHHGGLTGYAPRAGGAVVVAFRIAGGWPWAAVAESSPAPVVMPAPAGSAGQTLVSDYSDNRVALLGSDGDEIWSLDEVYGAWDAQLLPNGHVLITEFALNRVRELDVDGQAHWEFDQLKNPYRAQRLPGGDTLICDTFGGRLIEVDAAGAVVWEVRGIRPMDAVRLVDGTTVVADGAAGSECVRFIDRSGQTVRKLDGMPSIHAVSVLPGGHLLVTLRRAHEVREYDLLGAVVWKLSELRSPSYAQRLPNGNTLVAENGGVREFDHDGREVWANLGSWIVTARRY